MQPSPPIKSSQSVFYFYLKDFILFVVVFKGNFTLISPSGISCINVLTLISLSDVKHIMTLPMKTMVAVLKVLMKIITCITAHPI